MACESPCFDCPFLRGADKLILNFDQIMDYIEKHFDADPETGAHEPIICEEQGDICFGQLQMMANGLASDIDPFSDIGEIVENMKPNTKEFFRGPWEFMEHHEA